MTVGQRIKKRRKELGMSADKLDAGEKFTVGDIRKINGALGLTTEEASEIFFGQ